MRRVAWLLLASVTAAGVILLFVFPGRTLLTQNSDIAVAEAHIGALSHENAVLRQRRAALDDPAEIERMARQRFGMVLSGQQAFAITSPLPKAPAATPARPRSARPWWRTLELWR